MTQQTDASTQNTILLELGKMQASLAVITEKLTDLPDHEARIRVLEAAMWRIIGAALGVSAVTSAIGAWIGHAVH